MNTLAELLRTHHDALVARFEHRMTTEHHQAMNAIQRCHMPDCGILQSGCIGCGLRSEHCHSCGHRSCPQCQYHAQQTWRERQRQKQLPGCYFLITFMLPAELRGFAWQYQRWSYEHLFQCAADTLKQFAENDPVIGSQIGMTGVLHTHTRKLDYHPHVHFIVAGSGFDSERNSWRAKTGKYLFNGRALAKVFRGKFLRAMTEAGYTVPTGKKPWIAQVKAVGNGEEAIGYLSRYLYRGVIADRQIIDSDSQNVTFQYQNSQTKKTERKIEGVIDFLWKVLRHTLPKGFRRARDYGFLHGNAKVLREKIQTSLKHTPPPRPPEQKVQPCCPNCGAVMQILQLFYRPPLHRTQTTN